MNVYDSARMADALAPHGYARVDRSDDADLIILNTCHIREKASEKVFSELGRLQQVKAQKEQDGGRTLVAVAGGVAQGGGEEILRRAPQVDLVLGPHVYHCLPELVERVSGPRTGARLLSTDFPLESKFDFLPEEQAAHGPAAFLTVQEGCDKFCS